MNISERVYFPQLTWLRGIAAFLVIISHSVRSTESPYSVNDIGANIYLFNALDLGSMAVTLFFALSGATLYINHKNDGTFTDLYNFILKRIFRIYPAFLVSLFLYLFMNHFYIMWYGQPKGVWMDLITVPYSLGDVLKHLFLLFDLNGNPFIINGAYWSLPVEFRFYLCFPIALLLLRYFGVPSLIILSFALASSVAILPLKPSIPHFFILAPSFFGGMLAAHIALKKQNEKKPYAWVVIILLFITTSMAWMHRNELPNIMVLRENYNWNIITSIFIVYFSLRARISANTTLIKSVLKFFGNISYSMYLLHQIALTAAFLICVKLGVTGNSKILLIFPTTILLTTCLAYFSYFFIERPGVELSKKLTK